MARGEGDAFGASLVENSRREGENELWGWAGGSEVYEGVVLRGVRNILNFVNDKDRISFFAEKMQGNGGMLSPQKVM